MNDLETQAIVMVKSVAMRFVKGGVSGAVAALAVLTIQAPTTWTELSTALIALIYATSVGFITGGILAVEKWLNWSDAPQA